MHGDNNADACAADIPCGAVVQPRLLTDMVLSKNTVLSTDTAYAMDVVVDDDALLSRTVAWAASFDKGAAADVEDNLNRTMEAAVVGAAAVAFPPLDALLQDAMTWSASDRAELPEVLVVVVVVVAPLMLVSVLVLVLRQFWTFSLV